MDNERHVIAEGSYGDGLSWLIWAQRQSPGDAQPGGDELLSMIRVTAGLANRATKLEVSR